MRNWLLSILLFSSIAAQANLDLPADATCAQLMENRALTEMVLENLAQLNNYPGNWAAASQQIMLVLIEHFSHREIDFAYFEKYFRAHDIPIYLVANSQPVPQGLDKGYTPALGKIKNGAPLYYLWVGVQGKDEADRFKRLLGITDAQNLVRLSNTGVLTVESLEKAGASGEVHMLEDTVVERLQGTKVVPPTPPPPELGI